jgi:hypothetical protein
MGRLVVRSVKLPLSSLVRKKTEYKIAHRKKGKHSTGEGEGKKEPISGGIEKRDANPTIPRRDSTVE